MYFRPRVSCLKTERLLTKGIGFPDRNELDMQRTEVPETEGGWWYTVTEEPGVGVFNLLEGERGMGPNKRLK